MSELNETIGYTTDGRVFFIVNSQIEGKPTQTIAYWNPDYALAVADAIKMAAENAPAQKAIGGGKPI